MRNEIDITYDGMNALIEKLGIVEAEKFISIIQRENFDYTEWQKRLWNDKSVRELSRMAMEFRAKNRKVSLDEIVMLPEKTRVSGFIIIINLIQALKTDSVRVGHRCKGRSSTDPYEIHPMIHVAHFGLTPNLLLTFL